MVEYLKEINPDLNYIIIRYNKLISKIPKIGSLYIYLQYRWRLMHTDYDSVLIFDELRRSNLFHTNKRKIAVIHDLKRLKDSKRTSGVYRYYKQLIESCDSLIAISEFTKQDILKYYNVDERKIHVVYNSVCLPAVSVKPRCFAALKKYILYVNALHPYKNALTLVKAFNEIRERFDLDLLFVGDSTDYWENEVMAFVRGNGFADRVIRLDNLTNEELKYMYEHATLFVTTSLHEGFGYTPLEAAICKCPVISSRCEALEETTMNMVNYYEPARDAEALKEKMVEVLDRLPSKEELARVAEAFSIAYNPERQAVKILNVMDCK